MRTPTPLVYILIISYNGEEDVLRLLESLSRSTYPHCRTLLVDNDSKDDGSATETANWSSVKALFD